VPTNCTPSRVLRPFNSDRTRADYRRRNAPCQTRRGRLVLDTGTDGAAGPYALQAEVDAAQPREPLLTTWSGPGDVLAYTVAHGRDGTPQSGLVVLDTAEGRALARVHEPDLLTDAESRELVAPRSR